MQGGPTAAAAAAQHSVLTLHPGLPVLSVVKLQAVQAVLSALRAPAFSHTATAADTAACAQLRSTLFSQVPSWVHSIPADEQQFAADLVTAVMPDVDQLCAEDLAGLVTAVLAGMEQKQPHACTLLELLPVCLAALQAAPGPATSTQAAAAANAGDTAAEEEAGAAAAGGAVEAAKHRDAAVHRLCHCQWQPGQVCQILSVLKGLALTPEQMKTLLAKAIRACRYGGMQETPSPCLMFQQTPDVISLLAPFEDPAAAAWTQLALGWLRLPNRECSGQWAVKLHLHGQRHAELVAKHVLYSTHVVDPAGMLACSSFLPSSTRSCCCQAAPQACAATPCA